VTLLLILIGLLIPSANGWLLLGALQGRTPVLFRMERLSLGFLLGMTGTMFLTFCIHIVFGFLLSFWAFLGIQLLIFVILLGVYLARRIPFLATLAPLPQETLSIGMKVCIALLGAWTAMKLVVLASTFLFLTPTYFDDTVDNWNLRAKVFFHTQTLELVLPGKGDGPADVSSYPPTVSMAKAWMAQAAGWNDRAVNAIHLAWLLCSLTLVYCALRRFVPRAWSLLGLYAILSMPLYLMHGTNTYADIFMGAHVFAAALLLFLAIRSDGDERMAFARIGAVAAALLPFTKNEGLLVYLPPILLILAIFLLVRLKRKEMSLREAVSIGLWYAVSCAVVLVPWIAYKEAHGLTFGNAKGIGELGFGWQENVLSAITVNTFFEGNWLLLFPLFIGLLAWRWKTALSSLLPVTAFFLIVYVGQIFLYLFTGLSVEAILQTGYARGIIQLMPVIIFLSMMLLKDAYEHSLEKHLSR